MRQGGPKNNICLRRFFMRRVAALCAATAFIVSGIVGSTAAVARPAMKSGYYVIRWDNTGICTIWNTDLQEKPWHFLSDYKVVSEPVPTFAAAAGIQEQMRMSRRCTL
jgi:hypothetical protein